jgi:hypothetical protein
LPIFLQPTALPTADHRAMASFWARPRAGRPLRVALLLALLIMLNGFDLGFSLLADRYDRLIEMNPVAASFVLYDQWLPLAAYKLALVTVGVGILWRLRHRLLAECAAWAMVLAYVGVALRWHWFLSLLSSWQPYVCGPLT